MWHLLGIWALRAKLRPHTVKNSRASCPHLLLFHSFFNIATLHCGCLMCLLCHLVSSMQAYYLCNPKKRKKLLFHLVILKLHCLGGEVAQYGNSCLELSLSLETFEVALSGWSAATRPFTERAETLLLAPGTSITWQNCNGFGRLLRHTSKTCWRGALESLYCGRKGHRFSTVVQNMIPFGVLWFLHTACGRQT